MKFSPVLLLAGLASAVPCSSHSSTNNNVASTVSTGIDHSPNATAPDASSYENVDITDLSVREQLGNTTTVQSIESAYFVLNGNVTCTAQNPTLDGQVFVCGTSSYRFGLVNGTTTDYALRIYKATSQFAGMYGVGDVPTYCHSGGGSIEICAQVAETTIVISYT